MSADPSQTYTAWLVEQVQAGEERALTEFVERYSPVVVGWCRRMGVHENDREDVTQEVLFLFAKLLPRVTIDPQKGRSRSYFGKIARRFMGLYLKRLYRNPQPGGSKLEDVFRNLPNRDGAMSLIDAMIERLEEIERRKRVEEALQRLEEKRKPATIKAFRLHALDGIPAKEVAVELGMSVANVFTATMRVKKDLVQELGETPE